MLLRAPGFNVPALLALTLGIGATTTMSAVVNQVLLRPLPYRTPDALVRIRGGSSFPDIRDWMDEAKQFDGFGGYRAQPFDIRANAETERVDGALVTGRVFGVLGTPPQLGRLIDERDDRAGGDHVAVLSDGFWHRQFGGRPDVVGQGLDVAGVRYLVIGVLPAGFVLPLVKADVVAAAQAESAEFGFRGVHSLVAVGRLEPGTPIAAAQAEMDAIAKRLAERYPKDNADRRFVLQTLREAVSGQIRPMLWLLFGAVVLVLVIACANVANLQLVRAIGRRSEMTLRHAIGASPWRLTRQLLVEHAVLAVAGGLGGAVLAWWLLLGLVAMAAESFPRLNDVAFDLWALLFGILVSLATITLFGLAPMLSAVARRGLYGATGHANRMTSGRRRLTAMLVVAEIALTLILVAGAGLLLNSYARLRSVPLGFDAAELLTFNLTLRPLPRSPRPTSGQEADAAARTAAQIADRTQIFEQVIARLGVVPGVTAVAASTDLPIAEGSSFHNITFEGRPDTPGQEPEVYYRGVNPGFFAALGVPILKGREFRPADRMNAPPVAIVNATFAARYFPGADSMGARIKWGRGEWVTIVGVAADVKGVQVDADEVPAVYGPFMQDEAVWRRSMDFAVRTPGAGVSAGDVRRAVAAVDSTLPILRLQTMDQLIARSLADRGVPLAVLGAFAVTALLLAAVGLYGVVSFAVRARARELGVRLALGARPRDVVRLVLGQAWWCTVAGLAAGLCGALAAAGVLRQLLFQIAATDGVTYAVAIVGVGLVALGAAALPALRAARIDPLIALRRD